MSSNASKVLQWVGGIVALLTMLGTAAWFLMSFSISEASEVSEDLKTHTERPHVGAVSRTEYEARVKVADDRHKQIDKRFDKQDVQAQIIIDKIDKIGESQIGERKWRRNAINYRSNEFP